MNTPRLARALALTLFAATAALHAQVPKIINYQGRVAVDGVNFDSETAGRDGLFDFALVNSDATYTYWTNDGREGAAVQPLVSLEIPVTKGLYSVQLGDTSIPTMAAIPASVFDNPDVRLRVWFNDQSDGANTRELLTPDQRITSVGYAMRADQANGVADGAITSDKIAAGAVGASQIADYAITEPKLRLGTELGAISDGTLGSSADALTFTRTFDYPFAGPPNISLLSPGWTLSDVTSTGFSAAFDLVPVIPHTTPGIGGSHTRMVLADGHPAICYYQAGAANLVFVRATDPNGSAWGTPVVIDSAGNVGIWNSMAIINGHPAISYRYVGPGGTSGELRFVRATDPQGTAWPMPVIVDGGPPTFGNTGVYTSMAEVNGAPAISYHDGTTSSFRYVRANDADGTSWGVPVTVDADSISTSSSLKMVNGRPAVAYSVNADGGALRFARASDADGGTWGAPTAVNTGGSLGRWPSLEVINGQPAISYRDGQADDLKFARATDADGTTWDIPVSVDGVDNVGEYSSLAIVGGHPAISYYDKENDDLKYVQAADANGNSWGAPVTLDSEGNVGQWTTLAVVNGRAAISYYDSTNQNVKYVRLPELRWQADDGTVAPLTAAAVAEGTVGTAQLAAGALSTPLGVTGSSQAAVANTSYVANGDALTLIDLTETEAMVGDTIQIFGTGMGGWNAGGFEPWTARESERAWNAVASSDDGTRLIAADINSKLYTSSDSGKTWTPRDSVRRWGAVASSNSGQYLVAAAGYFANAPGDKIYTSDDWGETWTPRGVDRFWSSVASSANGDKLVAVANSGTIFTSENYGQTWTERMDDANRGWYSVASSTQGDILIAAVRPGKIYTSTDSGVIWTERITDTNRFWEDVAISGNGLKMFAVAAGEFYTSIDSGETWTSTVNSFGLKSLACSANGTKLIGAEDGGKIYISTDSGATWTAEESDRGWNAVASSADGSKLVATGAFESIYTKGAYYEIASGAQGTRATLQYQADGSWTPAKESQIADGSVGDASISSTASISDTKLATLTTPGKVANSATTGTPANIPDTLVLRDGNGSFATQDITLEGNLNLANTDASGNNGVITQGGRTLIHTFGDYNFFAGYQAGNFTMTGGANTAIGGYQPLRYNTTGENNTASGTLALTSNTSGNSNTANGMRSLASNTTGSKNTASGHEAMFFNDSGEENTATGYQALKQNTTGSLNTASGTGALNFNTEGHSNSAFGSYALQLNSTGSFNTAVGINALYDNNGDANTALGNNALGQNESGSNNTAIGNGAGFWTDGDYNITIGHQGVPGEDHAIRIGTVGTHDKTLLVGNVGIGTSTPDIPLEVNGAATPTTVGPGKYFDSTTVGITDFAASGGIPISIKASHNILATGFDAVSDERIKVIQGRSDSASDLGRLLRIEITDYHYKDKIDKGARPQKKVIAQQVETVYPQAVNKTTDVVPDIFQKALIKDGWVALTTDLKVGERVRLVTEAGHRAVHEVLELGQDRFRTDFAEDVGEVFVYGREVKDFRSVDYEAISMLNVSATQELARKVELLEEEKTNSEAEIARLQKQVAAQAQALARQADHHKALDARLAALEQAGSPASVQAVKVALKK